MLKRMACLNPLNKIGRVVADPPVESLPNQELLALCDATLDAAGQEELSALLADLREGTLATSQRARLEELMAGYRRGLVLKARALTAAGRPDVGLSGLQSSKLLRRKIRQRRVRPLDVLEPQRRIESVQDDLGRQFDQRPIDRGGVLAGNQHGCPFVAHLSNDPDKSLHQIAILDVLMGFVSSVVKFSS